MPKRGQPDSSFDGMHVLATSQFDEAMLAVLFDAAAAMKRMVATKRKSDLLRGHILANVFFELQVSFGVFRVLICVFRFSYG